jgi:hypothetical protein
MTAALQKLAAFNFPVRTTATTRAYFAALADLQTGQVKADMKAVAQAVPDAAAAARLSRDPEWNALLRTTCVATMMQGGQGESALPNRAHATVQCRLLPGDTPEQTLATLTRVVGDPGVNITVDEPIDPSPETPPTPEILALYKKAADRVWPGSVIIPEMAAGASDSVYARLAGLPSYLSSTIFIEDSRAHARDERVLTQAYDEAGEYGYQLLKVISSRSLNVNNVLRSSEGGFVAQTGGHAPVPATLGGFCLSWINGHTLPVMRSQAEAWWQNACVRLEMIFPLGKLVSPMRRRPFGWACRWRISGLPIRCRCARPQRRWRST